MKKIGGGMYLSLYGGFTANSARCNFFGGQIFGFEFGDGWGVYPHPLNIGCSSYRFRWPASASRAS